MTSFAKITREMVEQRLSELRDEQILKLSEASVILGRIQEIELLLIVLEKKEGEGEDETPPPPPPALVEVEKEDEARNEEEAS